MVLAAASLLHLVVSSRRIKAHIFKVRVSNPGNMTCLDLNVPQLQDLKTPGSGPIFQIELLKLIVACFPRYLQIL